VADFVAILSSTTFPNRLTPSSPSVPSFVLSFPNRDIATPLSKAVDYAKKGISSKKKRKPDSLFWTPVLEEDYRKCLFEVLYLIVYVNP